MKSDRVLGDIGFSIINSPISECRFPVRLQKFLQLIVHPSTLEKIGSSFCSVCQASGRRLSSSFCNGRVSSTVRFLFRLAALGLRFSPEPAKVSLIQIRSYSLEQCHQCKAATSPVPSPVQT